MRLAEFIRHDLEATHVEWEAFVTLLPAATGMPTLAPRDRALEILEAVAKDLTTLQTREEQSEKLRVVPPGSRARRKRRGRRTPSCWPALGSTSASPSRSASVLRLWMDSSPHEQREVEDIVRFNEAIDQTIAEPATSRRMSNVPGTF